MDIMPFMGQVKGQVVEHSLRSADGGIESVCEQADFHRINPQKAKATSRKQKI